MKTSVRTVSIDCPAKLVIQITRTRDLMDNIIDRGGCMGSDVKEIAAELRDLHKRVIAIRKRFMDPGVKGGNA